MALCDSHPASVAGDVRREERITSVYGSADLSFVEKRVVCGVELAQIFLREVARSESPAFLFEETCSNAGAIGGGDAEPGPAISAIGPFVVEEAALAVWSTQEPQASAAHGEHGTEGAIEFVGNAGGFVDEHQRNRRESAHGGFDAGDADDAGAVGKSERDFIIAIAARFDAQFAEKKARPCERTPKLWRADGLATRIREPGSQYARWTALAAQTVDLPHWRVQLRMTWFAVDWSTRA